MLAHGWISFVYICGPTAPTLRFNFCPQTSKTTQTVSGAQRPLRPVQTGTRKPEAPAPGRLALQHAGPSQRRARPVHCGHCSSFGTLSLHVPRRCLYSTPCGQCPSRSSAGLRGPGHGVPAGQMFFPRHRGGSWRDVGWSFASRVNARSTCSFASLPLRASGSGGVCGTRSGRREPAAAAATAKWRRPWRTPGG